MAKVSYIEIPEELKDSYSKSLQPGDRFVFPRITLKKKLVSRKRKIRLRGQSIFTKFAVFWKDFTDEQKDDWRQAGLETGLTNWQLFIQDHAARLAADLPGYADPKTLHQSWIGKFLFESFSDELLITQIHPKRYWIRQKVSGTKSQFQPVKIIEDFSLPLQISINYYSDLQSQNDDFEACFYADIWYSYQGVDLIKTIKIDFDLQSDWKNDSIQLDSITGQIIGYSLYFYFKNLTGEIYFDNIKAEHSEQNWVRDSACTDLTESFPIAFYQVPAHWFVIDRTDGAHFGSVYRDF